MFKSHIETDPRYGRSLVTTEHVRKGDVVVDELPFAWGSKQNSGIVCLGCYRDLQFDEDGDSMDRCLTCDWPLCSACVDSVDHLGECRIFSEANVRFAGNVSEDGICAQLDCITPLSLKAVLLHASNRKPSNPLAMGINMKESYETLRVLKMTQTAPHVHTVINHTEVCYNPVLGRYLTNGPKITKSANILIEEKPFALGPKCNGPVVCLECYCHVICDSDDVLHPNERCPKCSWPLCVECQENNNSNNNNSKHCHANNECLVFSKAKMKFYNMLSDVKSCPQLDCITPLRVLLAKEAYPERWEKEVSLMEYHDKERRENAEIWHADLINIAQYLRGPCKLGDRFSEDLIMQVVGILEVNAFEAKSLQGFPLRALYPITGILSHSCVPNTMRSIYPSEDYRIRLRAMVDLEPGQQLQHSYSYTLNGTTQRQEHLKTGKYFSCDCKRCKDPTELGTNFSTFKCSKCEDGWLLWSDPLDAKTEWKCTLCEFKTSSDAIRKALSVMQAEVSELQTTEMSAERLQLTEKLLKKYRVVLHPLHFIMISLKQNLIEMYGRVKEYEMVELPDILLERKEELCRQVLRVMNVFEPGLSRMRAMILYELHVPVVLLAKSGFIAEVLTGSKLKEKIQEAITILKDCVEILQYEDSQSQEGVLGLIAKQAMEQLTQSVEGLGDC